MGSYYAGDSNYAGDYYQGDNYAAGGLLGSLGKLAGGLAKKLLPAVPFVGPVASTALSLVGPSSRNSPTTGRSLVASGPGTLMSLPEPGVTGIAHRFFEGGKTGYGRYTKDGRFTDRRRPRMQYTNTRALKRAGRRVRGFLRIARSLGALPIGSGKGKKLFKRKHK